MYKGRRIVICVPAGRRKFLEVLMRLLLDGGYPQIVDECQMWLNTTNFDDIQWIKSYSRTTGYPWVQVKKLPGDAVIDPRNIWWTVCKFYRYAQENDTIYVKIDDDTVLVDSLERFKRMLDFRIENPEYFLVSANVLNNSICTHMMQTAGCTRLNKLPQITCDSHDRMGMTGKFAEALHHLVAENDFCLDDFHFTSVRDVADFKRLCINCVLWFGEDMLAIEEVPKEDEIFLSMTIPSRLNRKLCVFGEFTVVHFGYGSQQRHLMENTTLMEGYRKHALGRSGEHDLQTRWQRLDPRELPTK